ncbi:MAG: hypothetical protein WD942_08735 [Dehalococcoidia bacterium]
MTNSSIIKKVAIAERRVVFVAPAVSDAVARALVEAHTKSLAQVTIVLAGDEEAYRLGLGDLHGLECLESGILQDRIPIRRQPGLRMGLLVVDDQVTIWSPTPSSVESERKEDEPNGITLQGAVADSLAKASGADQEDSLSTDRQIGREALRGEEIHSVIESLKKNPPAPVDLSRMARVFSTRFQFVEVEVRGAEWSNRSIQMSTLLERHAKRAGRSTSSLLNADLPKDIQRVLESRIRPFEGGEDIAVEVPVVLRGEIAYRQDGSMMLVPMKEVDIRQQWSEIRGRYLVQLKGFGWLIRKADLGAFRQEAKTYATVLTQWVEGFHRKMDSEVLSMVEGIIEAVRMRMGAPHAANGDLERMKSDLLEAFEQQRARSPKVRILTKEISWESTRDTDFTAKLTSAFSEEDLKGWLDEFLAVRGEERLALPG